MSYGQKFLKVMLKEGAIIPKEKWGEVITQVDEAVRNDHFHVIKKDGRPIGFFTYEQQGERAFINNCVIFKNERRPSNFLSLRKFFRDKFKVMWWESSRRDKLCYVK